MTTDVRYRTTLEAIDWQALKAAVAADDFDNGRSAEQLQRSFENSQATVVAQLAGSIVGTARALSDGVGNAYVVDVWTATPYRRRGIASTMMRIIESKLAGQHIALFSSGAAGLYRSLGYVDDAGGLSKIVGEYLKRPRG